MNIRYLTVLVLMITAMSCENGTPPPDSNATSLLIVNGKISNWTLGDSMIIRAYNVDYPLSPADSNFIFGSSQVHKDGSFSILLRQPSPKVYTGGYSYRNFWHPDSTWVISDSNAQYYYCFLGVFHQNWQYYKLIGNTNRPGEGFPQSASIGDYQCYFYFTDRDVSVSGTSTRLSIIPEHESYNVHLKKGWNRDKNIILSRSETIITMEETTDNSFQGEYHIQN